MRSLRGALLVAAGAVEEARDEAYESELAAEARWLYIIWSQIYAIGFGASSTTDLDTMEKITNTALGLETTVPGEGWNMPADLKAQIQRNITG